MRDARHAALMLWPFRADRARLEVIAKGEFYERRIAKEYARIKRSLGVVGGRRIADTISARPDEDQ